MQKKSADGEFRQADFDRLAITPSNLTKDSSDTHSSKRPESPKRMKNPKASEFVEEFVFSANGKGIFGEITRFENIKPSARKKFHRSKGRALVSMSSNFDNISKQFSASSITSNLLKEFTEQNVQYGKQNVGMQTPSLIHAFDDLILEFPCPLNKKVDFISSTLCTDLFLCENHD
jgi:hypothetical protein